MGEGRRWDHLVPPPGVRKAQQDIGWLNSGKRDHMPKMGQSVLLLSAFSGSHPF